MKTNYYLEVRSVDTLKHSSRPICLDLHLCNCSLVLSMVFYVCVFFPLCLLFERCYTNNIAYFSHSAMNLWTAGASQSSCFTICVLDSSSSAQESVATFQYKITKSLNATVAPSMIYLAITIPSLVLVFFQQRSAVVPVLCQTRTWTKQKTKTFHGVEGMKEETAERTGCVRGK